MNRFLRRLCVCLTTLAALCATVGQTWGHGGGGDIAIFTNHALQQVDIGFAVLDDDDISQEVFDPTVSVFQAVLIPNTPSTIPPIPYSYGTREPGFDSEEALPPLKTLRANTLDLWYWDGAGTVDMQPAASLGITGGYAPASDVTQATGGFHGHPMFGLEGDAIPDGIYIAKVTISVDTLADSNPYYLVTLKNESLYTGDPLQDAEHGEMVGEAVRAYLDDPSSGSPMVMGTDYTFYADAVVFARALPVPEPATSALLALGIAGGWLVSRRRKQR